MRIPGKMREMGFDALAAWAKEAGLEAVDLPSPDAGAKAALDRGARRRLGGRAGVGASLSKDEKARAEGVAQIKEDIDAMVSLGMTTLFCCLIPADPATPRAESFAIFKETYPEIVAYAAGKGILPGDGAVPRSCASLSDAGLHPGDVPGLLCRHRQPGAGDSCYDPSHYVRMGIDYLRVLDEFGGTGSGTSTARTPRCWRKGGTCTACGPDVPPQNRLVGGGLALLHPGRGRSELG